MSTPQSALRLRSTAQPLTSVLAMLTSVVIAVGGSVAASRPALAPVNSLVGPLGPGHRPGVTRARPARRERDAATGNRRR